MRLLFILLFPASVFCQRTSGPLKIFDSIEVKTGDTVYFGSGSTSNGDFAYAYYTSIMLPVGQPVNKGYGGLHGRIKFFRELSSRKLGNKVYAVLDLRPMNAQVDLEMAINAGEVVRIGDRRFTEKALLVTGIPVASKADELIKLKGLLDSGALTQGEYDAEKKKILAK